MTPRCRLYDRLFTEAEPEKDGSASAESSGATKRDFKSVLNPHSLEVVTAKCEPSLKDAKPELRYQFERLAYFALDKDSTPGKLVFNRTITLKDAWAKGSAEGIGVLARIPTGFPLSAQGCEARTTLGHPFQNRFQPHRG